MLGKNIAEKITLGCDSDRFESTSLLRHFWVTRENYSIDIVSSVIAIKAFIFLKEFSSFVKYIVITIMKVLLLSNFYVCVTYETDTFKKVNISKRKTSVYSQANNNGIYCLFHPILYLWYHTNVSSFGFIDVSRIKQLT